MIAGQLIPLGLSLTLLALCLPAPARAQFSVSAALESDYRYRGLSLSEGRPSLSIAAAYDSGGFYGGAAAIGQDTAHDGARMLGFVEYAGYAFHRPGSASFDLGVNNQDYSEYSNGPHGLHYSEVYVGVTRHNLSAHVYYSPNYLRPGWRTLYTDLSGAYHPADKWRLFGHFGALTPVSGPPLHERYDLRVGVAREFKAAEVHLAVTATSPNPPLQTPQHRTALVVGASYFF